MPVVEFKGTWTAMVTPFNADNSLDLEGFEKNINFQIQQGATGLVPVGTTGESPTLSEEEHKTVIKSTKKFAGNRCGILSGAGSNSTREALDYCRHSLDTGID
ncbi:MAG: dihydrodipicolinate synthase family protein, partial [Spirochaetota bacterium]